jgi:hypothetical protein
MTISRRETLRISATALAGMSLAVVKSHQARSARIALATPSNPASP